jgi:hypothetical protein
MHDRYVQVVRFKMNLASGINCMIFFIRYQLLTIFYHSNVENISMGIVSHSYDSYVRAIQWHNIELLRCLLEYMLYKYLARYLMMPK